MSAITLAGIAAATHGAEPLTFRFSEVWIIIHQITLTSVTCTAALIRIPINVDERRRMRPRMSPRSRPRLGRYRWCACDECRLADWWLLVCDSLRRWVLIRDDVGRSADTDSRAGRYRSLPSDLLGLGSVWEHRLQHEWLPDGDLHPVSLSPRWLCLKPCGFVASRGLRVCRCHHAGRTVPVAFTSLAKSTSYPSVDPSV